MCNAAQRAHKTVFRFIFRLAKKSFSVIFGVTFGQETLIDCNLEIKFTILSILEKFLEDRFIINF